MSFDLPLNVILKVDVVDVRLDPSPHPFESGNARAIAENWRQEIAANPRLFDGEVALLSELSYRNGRLVGCCHIVRYSTFLYWRAHQNTPDAGHAYAHAVLVSGDNALIAIRMAAHTVNAGRVYFAAGSFEPIDFHDGVVDVDFNMIREVREETGLDLTEAVRGEKYHVLSTERGTVIFRHYRMALTANEIVTRINAFVASETESEIVGPVVIHSAADLPDGLLPHMKPLIEWHFSGAD